MRKAASDSRARLALYHALLLGAVFAFWYAMTTPGLVSEAFAKNTAFFFGKPLEVLKVIWIWFSEGKIYPHLGITLVETLLAFAAGSVLGLAIGLWLALSPLASALADPYIKAANAMPRVILAPIFAVWFGLGITSKVALGITLVFFIVFFNVFQGVKEVSPTVLANARMLGATKRQLLQEHLPAVGDVVGVLEPAHVGRDGVCRCRRRRVPGLRERRRLSDPAGGRRIRHQHGVRRNPRAHRVCAGAGLRRHARRSTASRVAATRCGDGNVLISAARALAGEGRRD